MDITGGEVEKGRCQIEEEAQQQEHRYGEEKRDQEDGAVDAMNRNGSQR